MPINNMIIFPFDIRYDGITCPYRDLCHFIVKTLSTFAPDLLHYFHCVTSILKCILVLHFVPIELLIGCD